MNVGHWGRNDVTWLLNKGFKLTEEKLHDLLDVLNGRLMGLLVEIPVHYAKDWADGLDSCGSLIAPQHLVLL